MADKTEISLDELKALGLVGPDFELEATGGPEPRAAPPPTAAVGPEPGSEAPAKLETQLKRPSGSGGEAAGKEEPVTVRPVQFSSLAAPAQAGVPVDGNLDLLLEVALNVTVELGRVQMTVQEIIALQPGSIVELDKLAGEPVSILVNGMLVGYGEVVVVDERFGVRVTEIISPDPRLGVG